MPRKRARFSGLIRRLRDAGPSPSNPELQAFLEWLQGQREVDVQNQIPAGGRRLFPLYIFAFGRDYDAGNPPPPMITSASAYSLSGLATRFTGFTNADAELGHDVPDAEKSNAVAPSGFYPALVRIKVPASGVTAPTNKTSGITGRTYDYQYARTFSLPFGRRVASPEEDEVERRVAVEQAAGGIADLISVNFESEVYKEEDFGSSGVTFDNAEHGVEVP